MLYSVRLDVRILEINNYFLATRSDTASMNSVAGYLISEVEPTHSLVGGVPNIIEFRSVETYHSHNQPV